MTEQLYKFHENDPFERIWYFALHGSGCVDRALRELWGHSPSDCDQELTFWLGRVQEEPKEYELVKFGYMRGVCMLYLFTDRPPHFLCPGGPLHNIDVASESFRAYSFWLGAPMQEIEN